MTLQIISLEIDNKKHLYFWRGKRFSSNELTLTLSEVIKSGNTSHFYTEEHGKSLFKLFKTKQHQSSIKIFTENIDKYLWLTSAAKELNGNKLLADIGLSVPEIYGIGFPLSVTNSYRCLLVQQHLPNTTALKFYANKTTTTKLKNVLNKVFSDMWKMRHHNLFFRDMRPVDVLIDEGQNIHWVDTRVKEIKSNDHFNKLFDKQLNIFINDLVNFGFNKKDIIRCIPNV